MPFLGFLGADTHPLNTTLQKTRRTNRLTHSHKQCTRQSITLRLCSMHLQKERAGENEVVERAGLLGVHRLTLLAAL